MATKTIEKWNPFGVELDITATTGTVKRISATQFTVYITASWKTYWSAARTNYGMQASSGGYTKSINTFGVKASSGSGSFTGTYSMTGNDAQTRTITVTFRNFNTDNGDSATKSISLSVSVPAWTSYTVSYNANGGTGAPASQTKWKDQSLTLSNTKPTRTGYTFLGWALSKTDADNLKFYYTAGGTCGKNENLTLYAVWKANTYTVGYNANGGKNAPSNQTKIYGKTLTLTGQIPTREAHRFLGWATSASSTTVAYKPGASYTSNASIVLYAVWELAYVKPSIKNLVVSRCVNNDDGSYTDDELGTYCHVRFDWETVYANTAEVVISLSVHSGEALDGISFALSGTSGTMDRVVWDGQGDVPVDIEITYDVSVVIRDAYSEYTTTATLSSVKPTIDYKAGGKGVAFGKVASEEGYADFGFEVCMNNDLRIAGRAPDGTIVEAFQPMNANGNTVVGWGNKSRKAGNTNVYGNVVNVIANENVKITGTDIILTPTNAGDDVRPYRRKGDSLEIHLRTAGYLTNAKKDLCFQIPLAVPVIGSPTITITSGYGFRLRQGEKYTHGCSATTYVFPDSYTATLDPYMGIRIVAVFSDVTNATNNDSIGIDWNGTITFT